ncbi:MAG: thiamine pyrophosphate-dependent enzyme [Coriobacteriia bacterium]|nr:thiamine pyrophosphate-dependent enzyme [Coriobacteriia bacterium]
MAKQLLMGNAAFAHAALESGVNVVAGYPGTPSSELVETVAALRASGAAEGVYVEWSTNEKAALEMLAGASLCGARTLFTCKQVGLNVASDPLLSLNYVGVKGGTVLFVADDPGPISSQTEQDTRRFASFAKVPVLDPTSPEQGFSMMKLAFELSEAYGTPIIVRPTTRINHASTYFDVQERTVARELPKEGFKKDPKWVIFPKRSFQAHGEINDRLVAMARDFCTEERLLWLNPVTAGGLARYDAPFDEEGGQPAALPEGLTPSMVKPKLGIVAGGVSAAYAREALGLLEQRAAVAGLELPAYRFMQVGTPFPFPQDRAADFAADLSSVLVLEELDHVLEDEMLKLTGTHHLDLEIHGKLDYCARDRGENDVDDIARRIALFFDIYVRGGVAEVPWFGPVEGAPFLSLFDSRQAGVAKLSWEVSFDQRVKDRHRALLVEAGLDPEGPFAGAEYGEGQLSALVADAAPYEYAPAGDQGQGNAPLPVRPPVLCAGCPHRGSFYAVKQALGKREAVYCGDIGCYTLGNAAPLFTTDTCLCMGAGITMAQGFNVVEPHKKQIAFVGDSTFFASGMTGMANAVYNGHDITLCVLDNSTTAMTGSQPHPGTGVTLMGARRRPISIRAVLEAMGVECIVRANPLDVGESVMAASVAIDFKGPSAVLFEEPCIQLKKPSAPARVDPQTCTGCKKCITEIGCPGIGFNAGATGPASGKRGQAFVDRSLCNGCGLCLQVCPFHSLRKEA